jgi:protein SCO1/2
VRAVLATLLWLATAAVAAAPVLADEPAGTSLYNLDSKWTSADGKTMTLAQALGRKKAVLAMIYTGCSALCPVIVERMKAIEEALPEAERPRVRFVLFSLDSTFDTPERLRAFAQSHGIEIGRWGLYRGDERAVRQLAMALGVSYRPDGAGGFDHSNLISLVDSGGSVSYQNSGTDAAVAAFVGRLVAKAP